MSKEPEVGRKCSAVLGRLPPHICCYPQPSADFHDNISAFLSDQPGQPRRLRRCACQCVQILVGQVWRTAPGDFLDPQHPLSVWRFHILLLKLSKYLYIHVWQESENLPGSIGAIASHGPPLAPLELVGENLHRSWTQSCILCFLATCSCHVITQYYIRASDNVWLPNNNFLRQRRYEHSSYLWLKEAHLFTNLEGCRQFRETLYVCLPSWFPRVMVCAPKSSTVILSITSCTSSSDSLTFLVTSR